MLLKDDGGSTQADGSAASTQISTRPSSTQASSTEPDAMAESGDESVPPSSQA